MDTSAMTKKELKEYRQQLKREEAIKKMKRKTILNLYI